MTPELLEKQNPFRSEAAARGVPPGEVDRWLDRARRCATLSPCVEGPVAGRFGGPLLLPAGAPDPFESNHLIASVDLAAVPADATDLPLPPDGRLLLLACPDGYSAADPHYSIGEAIHVPAGTAVEERPVDHGYEPDDVLADLDSDLAADGEMRLRYDFSLPDHDSIIDPAEHPSAPDLRAVWTDLRCDDPDLGRWSSLQLGGYPEDEYGANDPVADAAVFAAKAAQEGRRPPSAEGDWALLAQWVPQIYGLEGAFVHWAIAKRDLAARRFDLTWASMFFNP